MSRLVDDMRARARHVAGCSTGYRMARELEVARIADRLAHALRLAATLEEELALQEADLARSYASRAA